MCWEMADETDSSSETQPQVSYPTPPWMSIPPQMPSEALVPY